MSATVDDLHRTALRPGVPGEGGATVSDLSQEQVEFSKEIDVLA